jgi:hypothetical protein
MRSAIFVIWSSVLLFPSVSFAQEKSWEFALTLHAYNSGYEETFINPKNNDPMDAQGNSFTAFAPHLCIAYRARQDLHIPIFLTIEGTVPLVTMKGLEVGHETKSDGTVGVTYKTDAQHNDLNGKVLLGVEILPFLQPYVAIERSNLTSRRTGQLDGNDHGGFEPDQNPDYSEPVLSTHLGFGVQGTVPLNENADIRIRYDLGYEIPQTVSVSNTSFDPGTWGQGTTGYTYGGRIQLDLPLRFIELFTNHDGYWTIGGSFSRRHWNGDGLHGVGIFGIPIWPANTMVKAGGFIGVGLFF